MAINKTRIYENLNKLEILTSFLKQAAEDKMTMVEIGKQLNLTPIELNYELDTMFSRYFKKLNKFTDEEFGLLATTKDLPSTRLLKSIFGFKKSDHVVFPHIDEDSFWAVIKNNYSDHYYAVLSMHYGYGVDTPMTFEKIAEKLGCTKAWANEMCHKAKYNFNSQLLYEIYNYEYINKKAEIMASDQFADAKKEYETLMVYMSRVDDIKKLNEYISKNYPEVHNLDLSEVNKMFSIPVTQLELSNKLVNVLTKNNINTLADIYMTSAIKFKNMSNFGKIKCVELLEVLTKRNDDHPNRDILIKNLNELINN